MPTPDVKYLNMTDYARHRKALGLPGGTYAAVRSAIADGRIKRSKNGKIDVAQADADWVANTKPRKPRKTSLADFKAELEGEKLKIQRLKRRQLEGRLIEVDDVKTDAAKTSRAFRDHLLAIPERMAPVLAGLDDPHDIRDALDTEIRQALDVLSTSKFT